VNRIAKTLTDRSTSHLLIGQVLNAYTKQTGNALSLEIVGSTGCDPDVIAVKAKGHGGVGTPHAGSAGRKQGQHKKQNDTYTLNLLHNKTCRRKDFSSGTAQLAL
jgi:hypothetical protein